MKKTITILTAIIILAACSNEKKQTRSAPANGAYPGVFKKNGAIRIGEIMLVMEDRIEVDSITKEKKIITDTAYGIIDRMNTKTKEGKDTTVFGWVVIAKDSVKITSTITLDSLVKSFK